MSYYIMRTSPGGSFLSATGGEALKYFGLPLPGAIRFRFSNASFDPNTITGMAHDHTWTKVPGISTNEWEYYQKHDKSFHNAFYNKFTNANNLVTIIDSDLTGVTDLSGIFYGCTSLTNSDLKNTGSVTNMEFAFYNCSGISSISTSLDTHNVTNMRDAFCGCTSITSIPATLDTSKAEDLSYAFSGCTNLTAIPTNISVDSATNIGGIFFRCINVSSGILAFYNRAIAKNNKPKFEVMGEEYTYSYSILSGTGSNTTEGSNEAKQTSYDYTGTPLTEYSTPHDATVKKLRSKIVMVTPLRITWSGLRILSASESSISFTEMCARWYKNATDSITKNRYGLFYNWTAIKYLIDHPSIISGWHVPTVSEYNTLINEFGGRKGLGWEYLESIRDVIPGSSIHYGATGFEGRLAGYSIDQTWNRDGILMLNWTSTVVSRDPDSKPNRFFCVCKEKIGGVKDAVGDATFMHMDAQTGNDQFYQVVLFKN